MAVIINTESSKRLGDIIKYHRNRAGLSRMALADIADVGKTVIYDIEKGKVTVRLKTLLKVLDALNIAMFLNGPLMDRYEAGHNEKS